METIKKVKMYENIQKHGNNLNAIFNTGLNPQLESSCLLEERLKNIECSYELKNEIENFIAKFKCNGKHFPISNIIYRRNLHYIEDNINKDGLLEELRTYNINKNKTK